MHTLNCRQPARQGTGRPTALLLAFGIFAAVAIQRPGRAPKINLRHPSTAAGLPELATAIAFPRLTFDRPVCMAVPGGGSNLMFVVEQHTATIYSFPTARRPAPKSPS